MLLRPPSRSAPLPIARACALLNISIGDDERAQGRGLVGFSKLLKSVPVQDTVSAGARWDFMSDVAFKLQFDRVQPKHGSRGTLINIRPGFRPDRPVRVTSAVLDFVS